LNPHDVSSGAAGHPAPEPSADLAPASRARRAAAAARRRRSLRAGASVVLTVLATGGMATGATASASGGTSASSARAASVSAGMSRATVRAVQRRLHLKADGIYGPRTRRAVKRFQRRHHLVVDGVVGPATLRALGLAARRAPAAREATARTNVSSTLQRIARCESGGNPRAISPGGRYRGKYQFDRATWAALGGTGDPAAAPEAEQDRRAAALLRARGTAPWPTCG